MALYKVTKKQSGGGSTSTVFSVNASHPNNPTTYDIVVTVGGSTVFSKNYSCTIYGVFAQDTDTFTYNGTTYTVLAQGYQANNGQKMLDVSIDNKSYSVYCSKTNSSYATDDTFTLIVGGGIFTPEFSETKIVDNSSLASSFTYSEDYHNYDFLKFKLYNSSSTNYTIIITTPTTIDNIYALTSVVNFNEMGSNKYANYSQSGLTWTRAGRNDMDIYEIYGLDCINATVTETQIYKASSMSSTWVDVTTQLNLFDFDWIMFASISSTWDEYNPCNEIYVPNRYTYNLFDESLRYFVFNKYANTYVGTIGNHYLGALPYGYVAGIKFTPN